MISLTEYQKKLSKESIKRVNLIFGEEEYLVKTLIDKLKDLYPLRVIWGDELSLQEFERTILSGGMFGGKEILFVYRSLDLLKWVKDIKRFSSFLEKVKDKFIFFYIEGKLSEKDLQKEPYATISKLGDVISASKLDKKRIRDLVKNKLQKEGINIEDDALEYLLSATSYQLVLLKGETDKILLYGKPKITLEDVKRIVVADLEMGAFEFLDGLFLKDYEKAINSLQSALRFGTHPLQILALLVGYALRLYTAKALMEEGKSLEETLNLLDVKHPFQRLTFKNYLSKNSKEELYDLLRRLYMLDIAIKVYYADPSTSLGNFVIEYMLNEESQYYTEDTGDQDRADLEP
ncbi:MAG: DNA polymerase III subunit delta [Aquificaceae bacterium]